MGRRLQPRRGAHRHRVNTARIWDAATAKEIAVLRGHEDIVWAAAFSPDGTRVVTASRDNTARLWDAHFARASRLRRERISI